MEALQLKSRYPGIRAFEKNERHVFFGRRLEAKKLYNLVKAKPLVVLFAKSGIGKSSLINAGLEPILEKDYFYVVKIRLQTTAISSIEMVKNELKPYLNEAKLKKHAKGEPGLWEYLRACEFKKGEDPVTPVLVFDQFEEFFEHDKNDQDELNNELADMVSNRLPERIRESLRSIPFRDRTKEQLAWHAPIPVKFVFAIRSDRMSRMDEMSEKIPSILHNRFHLKPLNIASAREAIIEPAALEGSDFDTAPFTYAEPALNTMLGYLKNKKEEIESFQLQLLCRNIEKTVQKKKTDNVVVTENDFGGATGIKSILNNYYEQEVSELETTEQPLARKFIEEGLIVAGRRVGISEGVEEKSFGINPDLLSKLLASRLIRAENTHLGRSYELSHDTLVAPILQSYEIRRRAEERQEAIEKQKEQEALLEKERKKRNQARLLALAGFILFLIAAAGGFFAAKQSQVAKKQREKARAAEKKAIIARRKAEDALAQVERAQLEMARTNLENGKSNMDLGNYDAAILNFKTVNELELVLADSIVNANKSVFNEANSMKSQSEKIGGAESVYKKYMKIGNEAYGQGNYQFAYEQFKQAKNLNLNTTATTEANLKLEGTTNQMLRAFSISLDKAPVYIRADGCVDALKEIRKAEKIIRVLPTNKISQADRTRLRNLKAKCQ